MPKQEILLLTVRGKDAPGITAKLTSIIAQDRRVKILDIEQTVVHKKLLLSILMAFPGKNSDKASLLKELLFAGKEIGVEVHFEIFEPDLLGEEMPRHQYVITCLAEEVGAHPLSQIARALAKRGMNIDKISKLALKNIHAIELIAHAKRPLNPKKLSKELLGLSNEIGVDIAIQKHDLLRRAKRLVVMDMDSTLIQTEVIDALARQKGIYKKVAAITKQAMNGNLSFTQSLKKRVGYLKGLSLKDLEQVHKRIRLTPGAARLLKVLRHLGYKTALISGGFTYFTDRLKNTLGFDYTFANRLEMRDGKITGRVAGTIIDAKRKALILETLAQGEKISLDQTIAIGDGANDIPMLTKAGLGIAFKAKPVVAAKAHYRLSKQPRLDSILYLLGISEREIKSLR
ncbi:MAG: phosphoserine phosphatase SerB [Deltaproteobacteria bacterium]|nr:phosphoserine phosphatase SerB [Deltaproteobacteria bacterium]MBI4223474.1 phosphoserine phosphatase SerB [Deltaproteobacteria bacterium]